ATGTALPRADDTPGAPTDGPDPLAFPATPVSGHPHDPFGPQAADLLSNSSKKSRSKPTRNADGVLIRKDGRPDMRSVSSAKNLRAVHAKREAERAEEEAEGDGRTPMSGRSLALGQSNSMSEEDAAVGRSGTPEEEEEEGEERDPEPDRGSVVGEFSQGAEGGAAAGRFAERDRELGSAVKEEIDQEQGQQRLRVDREDDHVARSTPAGTALPALGTAEEQMAG
ncbi:hypothetical protein LTR53_018467, partial [Teratosphaeriaceae sp. CCFEE 6253]